MSFSGLVKAYSVPFCRKTLYCSGVNSFFHSASVLITFLIPLDFELSLFDFVPSPCTFGLLPLASGSRLLPLPARSGLLPLPWERARGEGLRPTSSYFQTSIRSGG